jgi:hypothetical protein
MRSLLALQPVLAARHIDLHVELGGGEPRIDRARAAMMANFLDTPATHLLFVDPDVGFAPEAVIRLLDAGRDVIGAVLRRSRQPAGGRDKAGNAAAAIRPADSLDAGFMLISRLAAERLASANAPVVAKPGVVSGPERRGAENLFGPMVEPATRRRLSPEEAFAHRWRALGGELWADFASPLQQAGVVAVVPNDRGDVEER